MSALLFSLPIPGDQRRRLAIGWLMLGIGALLASGVFSVLLVLFRTPFIQNLFPKVDFFHVALVVHVDLSVLVWFLAFAGALWSLNGTSRGLAAGWLALAGATAGTVAMSLAPFTGHTTAVMSNYIPVLDDPLFLGGLVVFFCACLLLVLRGMTAIPPVGQWIAGTAALRFGLNTAAVSTVVASMAFIWTWLAMPDFLSGKDYYELLFWGGGHVLQFTYTLLMLVAWLWLASASGIRPWLTPRVALLLFALGLATVFAVPLIYLGHDVTSPGHIRLFTWLMEYGGSLATLPLGLAVLIGLLRASSAPHGSQPLRAALVSSIILFGFGGLIGFLIQGSNVTIPAHYHGCIVGITLAFMGLTYHLLPPLGFHPPPLRLAHIQPYLYGGGQLLHVIGLLWSGGYGVQRKTAGTAQGLEGFNQIAAMGLMGLGGLIAIIGGLLFLLAVYRAIRPKSDRDLPAGAG
jgi:hypothetical protein